MDVGVPFEKIHEPRRNERHLPGKSKHHPQYHTISSSTEILEVGDKIIIRTKIQDEYHT